MLSQHEQFSHLAAGIATSNPQDSTPLSYQSFIAMTKGYSVNYMYFIAKHFKFRQ